MRGTCEGRIERAPRGQNGFGYDPLFLPSALDGRTLGEASSEEKNGLSHRAAAARLLRAELATWLVRPARAK